MSSEGEHYCITSMNLNDKEYDAVAPEILDSFRLTHNNKLPNEVMDAELPYETSLFEIEKAVYEHESRRGFQMLIQQFDNYVMKHYQSIEVFAAMPLDAVAHQYSISYSFWSTV
jgi:hypothetical protein